MKIGEEKKLLEIIEDITKGKTIKTKMNITNISKYVPVLTIDETDEMED